MLKVLRLAQLGIKLGPDLIEELVEASGIAGGHGPHAAVGIHGHGCSLQGEQQETVDERWGGWRLASR